MSTETIRHLNDAFRTGHTGTGRILVTQGVQSLGADAVRRILRQVMAFDAFTAGNDPHDEHDFGAFDHDGYRLFWKIDCYDHSLQYGSENPADPRVTTRVLTIMLSSEY